MTYYLNLVLQAKKQLASVEKDHKSEVNTIKMKHDSKVALMGEEIAALKAQSAKYRRERETLKEMMDSKPRSGRTSATGDESTELRQKVSDLTYQVIRFKEFSVKSLAEILGYAEEDFG